MVLIIGSVALEQVIPGVREPKDLDYFGPVGVSFHPDYDHLKKEAFWDESWDGSVLDRDGFATLDELYTIKISHAQWDLRNVAANNWDKHIADIMLMKKHGAVLDMELHKLLYPVWIKTHGRKQMNLNQAAGDFFDDAVVRIYDHDSIHDSCCFGQYPLYMDILKDGETVDIDPAKLWAMDHDTLVKLFREEIAATALERWILNDHLRSPGLAWKLALRKTITSLTRGKSARLILDNVSEFITPHNYMQIHRAKAHLLRPLDNNKAAMM